MALAGDGTRAGAGAWAGALAVSVGLGVGVGVGVGVDVDVGVCGVVPFLSQKLSLVNSLVCDVPGYQTSAAWITGEMREIIR